MGNPHQRIYRLSTTCLDIDDSAINKTHLENDCEQDPWSALMQLQPNGKDRLLGKQLHKEILMTVTGRARGHIGNWRVGSHLLETVFQALSSFIKCSWTQLPFLLSLERFHEDQTRNGTWKCPTHVGILLEMVPGTIHAPMVFTNTREWEEGID